MYVKIWPSSPRRPSRPQAAHHAPCICCCRSWRSRACPRHGRVRRSKAEHAVREKDSSAPRTRAPPAELPHAEGAEQDKKAPVINSGTSSRRPPPSARSCASSTRAHGDTGLLFLCFALLPCVVVGRAFDDRRRERAATIASTRRQAAQALGQRRIGIVRVHPFCTGRLVVTVALSRRAAHRMHMLALHP